MPIELGDVVRDTVTGFTGIATVRADYLDGRPRILIEPPVEASGKPIEAGWFDEPRIERVEAKAERIK